MGNAKFDFIPFGAQYYRAPTPRSDQWDKDMERFFNHGFNTIKIWLQWRWNNPAEGEFDFSDIDRLMDLAQKNNIKVIINTIFDVAPSWFYRKHPESIMIMCNGRKLTPRTTACRQIGGAPGPCYHHEEGIRYRMELLEAAAKRYAEHPALLCWDLWNEPEISGGIYREPDQDSMVCYCEKSIAEFISWLKRKYNTLENLNRAWQRNYRCWDDVEAPRDSHVFNDMIDWRTFYAETLANELKLRVEVVKKWDAVHPVMVHTVPMPYFNMINSCCDDYLLAQHCDMFGNSLGSHPFAAAAITTSAEGKVTLNAEIHALGGDLFNRPHIPSFDDIKKHIFIPLARGVKGFLFWQYRPETLGLESPAWGLTKLDGGDTEWLEYAKKVNTAIKSYERIILDAMPPQAQIAVVNDSCNQIFDWCAGQKIDKHYHSVYGTFMALYDKNHQVDVISDRQIRESVLSKYKVLYYPFPYYMKLEAANVLRKWVEEGGILISECFFAGYRDYDGLHSQHVPGYGFDEVFGVKEGRVVTSSFFQNAYGKKWAKENTDANIITMRAREGYNFQGYFFCQELVPISSSVLAEFEDDTVAATCADYGNGKAIMLGSLIGYVYSITKNKGNSRFIANLVENIGGVRRTAYVENDKGRVDVLRNGDGQGIMVVSNNDPNTRDVKVILDGLQYAACIFRNIISGESYSPVVRDDRVEVAVSVNQNGIDAFAIEKVNKGVIG